VTWAKMDDRYDDSRKVKRAWRGHPRAVGLHAMAVTHCARHNTDGLIDPEWIAEKLPTTRERHAVLRVLEDCELFHRIPAGESLTVTDRDGNTLALQSPYAGEEAWVVHDYLQYNDSSVQRETALAWDRKRKELERDRALIAAIRERDGDRCRYCGKAVNWRDRRSSSGGTYDHVEPRGDNSLANVVVACRGCNLRKNNRTPDGAGMPLLPAGQIASSPRARSGLDASSPRSALPDPTRPDPTLNPPGPPPSGGRKRERERWEQEAAGWARGCGVDGPPESLTRAVGQFGGGTPKQFRDFCRVQFVRSLTVADEPQLTVVSGEAA